MLRTRSHKDRCNAKATSVAVFTGASYGTAQTTVVQPPATCLDACNEYHRLFTNVDVTNDVASSSLKVKTTASGVSTDHCGAGENLKVVFILNYSDQAAPA